MEFLLDNVYLSQSLTHILDICYMCHVVNSENLCTYLQNSISHNSLQIQYCIYPGSPKTVKNRSSLKTIL